MLGRFRGIGCLFARFGKSRNGSVIIVFALLLPVLVGLAGLALDVGRAHSLKQKLDAAADSAALAAAHRASQSILDQGGVVTTQSEGIAVGLARKHGEAIWAENTLDLGAPAVNITVKHQLGSWHATATYAQSMPTSLSGMFGVKTLSVAGTAEASMEPPGKSYLDLYLLMDTSQSMGLAATESAQNYMLAQVGCQFGCHVPGADANYKTMKSLGLPMRIDVLRDGTVEMLKIADQSANTQIRAGLWTFHETFTEQVALTSNLSYVQQSVTAVDLPTYEDGTHTDAALAKMTAIVPTSGDGSKSNLPKSFVFLITDGTQDGTRTGYWPASELLLNNAGQSVAAVDPAACDGLKQKGVTVAVLYTTYLAVPGQVQYETMIAPGAPKIPENLQACASPGFYIEASDATAIKAAMTQLLAKAVAATTPVRLTN